jgi:dolichyl-phosphate beta-glucosyltransferase
MPGDEKLEPSRSALSMTPNRSLSLVIPAYNEERRLPVSLRDIQTFFGKFPESAIEILVIIEKSSDRTLEFARAAVAGDPRFVIVDNQVHRGKGFAVKTGMLKARGELVFFMDADLSTPLSEVFKFIAHFGEHPETSVVIGSRRDRRSEIVKRQNLFRQSLGRIFNYFVKVFGVRGIKDTQCGFKAFRFETAQRVFTLQKLNGFAFDVEVLMLATELKSKIDVLPVVWVNSPDSKVRVFIDPLKMLWDLIRIRRIVRRSIRTSQAAN